MCKIIYLLCMYWCLIDRVISIQHDWDVAVTIEDRIELFNNNGTLKGITLPAFRNAKALAFDDVTHTFLVTDVRDNNDTIYRLALDAKHSVADPVVSDLPDDIGDLALDSVTRILYWTDSIRKRIMYTTLRSNNHNDENNVQNAKVLFQFQDEIPHGIVVDNCRRKLYWTNINHPYSTIERSDLNGSNHEVIARDGNIFIPSGLAIDQSTGRIYWSDLGEGIYFSIESSNLDGSDRRIILRDTHQSPWSIAVGADQIFWTDLNSNTLWSLEKNTLPNAKPKQFRKFNQKPIAVISRNSDYKNIPECHVPESPTEEEYYQHVVDSSECFNGGVLTESGLCICERGFTGSKCEIDLCYNYCFNGGACLAVDSYPKCTCSVGYTGGRCEHEICRGYCLNGGTCRVNKQNVTEMLCDCPKPFSGSRCHVLQDPKQLCDCLDGVVIIPNDGTSAYCSCDPKTELKSVKLQENATPQAIHFKSETELMTELKDPLFLSSVFVIILLLLVIMILSVAVCKMRHRRPRIKKRIIVNKNVQPLTCRPLPAPEQCEITIENCCNMNICETPCFEPSQFRAFQCPKKDEKKILLASMENGEDLY